MAKKINIAFLWHMHQPPYEDPSTGLFLLPWAYLHATKDYYDMAALLERHPRIKANFNFTPSLLEQIERYAQGADVDQTLRVLVQEPSTLSDADKEFLLRTCFDGCPDPMIERLPRFRQLLGFYRAAQGTRRAAYSFTEDEFNDLTTLFLLAWCGPTLTSDPVISGMLAKGRGFSAEDRDAILLRSRDHIARIIPLYSRLAKSGQIELSFSPYYHPLMPLVYNNSAAIEADPYISLPGVRFSAPEEVERQISLGLSAFERWFGVRPKGMWPPEGAISDAVLRLVAGRGMRWLASDEEVLRRSLGGHVTLEERLYPFAYNGLALFFRDRGLSDNIGFVYSRWPNDRAIEHFMDSLRSIAKEAPDEAALVLIAMDGENAWEFYPDGGYPFLDGLYKAISEADFLEPVTLSEYLERFGTRDELIQVATGSWVDGNLNTWIGDPVKNKAWEYLAAAWQVYRDMKDYGHRRPALVPPDLAMLRAEASDWFWWFGKGHSSVHKREFDYLFRQYLKAIYQGLGVPAPEGLDRPLNEDVGVLDLVMPTSFISPKITGRKDSFYKWVGAGRCEFQHGSIHRLSPILARVLFGFDRERFYLMGEGFESIRKFLDNDGFIRFYFLQPSEVTLNVRGCHQGCVVEKFSRGFGEGVIEGAEVAVEEVFEASFPVSVLSSKGPPFKVEFYIVMGQGGLEMERFPWDNTIMFNYDPDSFAQESWFV